MPSYVRRLLLLSLPLLAAASASADTAFSDCVDLSANHEAFRYANQALLVADGDAHYKLGFGGNGCDALMTSTTVDIATNGQTNRLCPKGSRVVSPAKSCAVLSVQRLTPDEYTAYQRRARAR
jgi:hypothetical protein